MISESAERDLYCSIGRVACESANTEEILRTTLKEYLFTEEAIHVIFEGQSYDWLTDTIRAVFKAAFDVLLETHTQFDSHKRNFEAVNKAFIDMRPLRDRRNFVIHGTWSICEAEDYCEATPSPSESADSPSFHFSRSRSRRYWQAQEHLTAIDINLLADAIKAHNETLSVILARARPIIGL